MPLSLKFSSSEMRMPLVDGHGNFGSLDNGPAAPRYTEARPAKAALLMSCRRGVRLKPRGVPQRSTRAFPSAQPSSGMRDRSYDDIVRREMRNRQFVDALWLRALAESDGNDDAARRIYRGLRVAQLRRQARRRHLKRTAQHGAFALAVAMFGIVALCSALLVVWFVAAALAPSGDAWQHLHVGLFFALLTGVSAYAAYLLWQQWNHVMAE